MFNPLWLKVPLGVFSINVINVTFGKLLLRCKRYYASVLSLQVSWNLWNSRRKVYKYIKEYIIIHTIV